ncbi:MULTISPECIES: substrate-binding domain-containing protein [Paenibacillus]|jgi:putative molybdopterin biosynthesis protein|uniref:substrate-binding domain-containing protein n=1 Tax=Paenibacillus TaxID=44249 RepID=UPI0004172039|nr:MULTISPECIES: helix-turn-helix transcriptional regulator [Paenibacillus]UMY54503.1 helix-turn-helix transcriptional regulator [Paenibacillus peoriae]
MNSPVSYTTEEIAKLLKISKLTVYDLIKKGEIPSYRVGKQMRVDASDLEAYKQRSKSQLLKHDPSPPPISMMIPPHSLSGGSTQNSSTAVITGQDISLDILVKHLESQQTSIRPLRSYGGSLDSLISMYQGKADIVSTHLWDGDSGEYNLPYIRKILNGFSYLVIRLLSRQAGLYVQTGNPYGLQGWKDLALPGLRLANREKGSGARILLDEQLRLHHIDRTALLGYEDESTHHMAVAGKVASGEADVGIGIEKAASIVGSVQFIPLIQEQYDIVMLRTPERQEWIDLILQILHSDSFRRELGAIQGYDLSETGKTLLET